MGELKKSVSTPSSNDSTSGSSDSSGSDEMLPDNTLIPPSEAKPDLSSMSNNILSIFNSNVDNGYQASVILNSHPTIGNLYKKDQKNSSDTSIKLIIRKSKNSNASVQNLRNKLGNEVIEAKNKSKSKAAGLPETKKPQVNRYSNFKIQAKVKTKAELDYNKDKALPSSKNRRRKSLESFSNKRTNYKRQKLQEKTYDRLTGNETTLNDETRYESMHTKSNDAQNSFLLMTKSKDNSMLQYEENDLWLKGCSEIIPKLRVKIPLQPIKLKASTLINCKNRTFEINDGSRLPENKHSSPSRVVGMNITGNMPKSKRKFDLYEKSMPAPKKDENDHENMIAVEDDLVAHEGEFERLIVKINQSKLQRTPGKKTVIKQTKLSGDTTNGRSQDHQSVPTIHNGGSTSTASPSSPSPVPSPRRNSNFASMTSAGSNSSATKMVGPCTSGSTPVDMREKAYEYLQQTKNLLLAHGFCDEAETLLPHIEEKASLEQEYLPWTTFLEKANTSNKTCRNDVLLEAIKFLDFVASLSQNPGTLTKQRVRRPDSNLSFQSDGLQPSTQISKDVFGFMINTFDNGYAAISDTRLLDFFKADESALTAWISKEKSNFRLLRHKNGDISVAVYDINIEPCQQFWSENGCDDEDCGKFHICKKLILQIPHNKHTCRFNHELSTSNNDKLIEESGFVDLTNEQILILLRNRYPKVCKEYQNNQCTEGIEFCPKLHICLDFIVGNCKKSEALCGLLHENGLGGKQSARLMEEFNLEQDCFPVCLYYEDITTAPRFTTDVSTFNAIKEEAICSAYISGLCNRKVCHLIHPRFNSQYLWQERKRGTEFWEDCQQSNNETFERAFCDPNIDCFVCGSYRISFVEDGNGIFSCSICDMEFRRLSTKSSVLGETNENNLTEWKWYWKEKDNCWHEYTIWTNSSQIEMEYLKANDGLPVNVMIFSTDQFIYEIDFVKMKQKNLDAKYGTEREIRRRPVFSSVTIENSAQIDPLIPIQWPSVPTHWPLSCKPGTRIPIADPTFLFQWTTWCSSSLGSHRSIISIEEVCNVNLFQIYQSKKMLMEKNGSANELWLFHGSPSTVINDICVQNLDWRLCGVNGTVYGQGTYFARDASYSDRFTRPDPMGCRYMFIAQVLVGQFTTGNRKYKRPPVRDYSTSELFDSVVDDVLNPTIIVIFERNQCYPRYLVKYR